MLKIAEEESTFTSVLYIQYVDSSNLSPNLFF